MSKSTASPPPLRQFLRLLIGRKQQRSIDNRAHDARQRRNQLSYELLEDLRDLARRPDCDLRALLQLTAPRISPPDCTELSEWDARDLRNRLQQIADTEAQLKAAAEHLARGSADEEEAA